MPEIFRVLAEDGFQRKPGIEVQRITVGDSPWAKTFERTKIEGRWAYQPASDWDEIREKLLTRDHFLAKFEETRRRGSAHGGVMRANRH